MSAQNFAYFCPECGSPSLDLPILHGGSVTCKACDWSGPTKDVAAMPLSSDVGSQTDVAQRMMSEFRILMAQDCGTPILNFLLKWGFMQPVVGEDKKVSVNSRQLGRYISAASRAMLLSFIEEMEKMEKERVHGN